MNGGMVDAVDGSAIPLEGGANQGFEGHYTDLPAPEQHVNEIPPLEVPQAMSIEDARRLLFEKHNVTVASDDPMLLMVTLHQGFIKDFAKLIEAGICRIELMLKGSAEVYAAEVEKLFKTLRGDTEQASIAHAIGLVKNFTLVVEAHQRAMRRHTILMTAITLLNLLAVGGAALSMAFSY